MQLIFNWKNAKIGFVVGFGMKAYFITFRLDLLFNTRNLYSAFAQCNGLFPLIIVKNLGSLLV